MHRFLAIALTFLALGSSADRVRFQANTACEDPVAVNDALFFAPWPPIDVNAPGGPIRIAISERGSATEGEVLAYFAAVDRALPTVTTEVRHDDHTIDEFVRIHRSWAYPGLSIAGQVTERGALYYERITLETDRYPLVCGLGIGQPLGELGRSLGVPDPEMDAGVGGVVVFTRPEEDVGSEGYALRASYDRAGRVTRLEWSLPLGH